MQKIVINVCHGGFGLSDTAMVLYAKLKDLVLVTNKDKYGFTHYYVDEVDDNKYLSDRDIARDDIALVQVVETLGKAASGKYAKLRVVQVPDDVEWTIEEYDGSEWVAEAHRTWS
jgi:hypothetical protein